MTLEPVFRAALPAALALGLAGGARASVDEVGPPTQNQTMQIVRPPVAAPPRTAVTNAKLWLAKVASVCDPARPPSAPAVLSWSGACAAGAPDGPGVLILGPVLPARLTLIGSFRHGLPEGHVTVTFPNGTNFDGAFRQGLPNGPATMSFRTGGMMVGELKDDAWVGKVHMVYPDGTQVDALYKDGLMDGPTTIQSARHYRIEGAYRAGKLNGPQLTYYPDGSRLEFDYADGVLAPDAAFAAPNGERFVGRFTAAHIDPSKSHALDYPIEARRAGQQGTAIISVAIAADGRVEDPVLVRTSGVSSLDDVALAGIRSWIYVPATVGDHPVLSYRRISIPFRLVDRKPFWDQLFSSGDGDAPDTPPQAPQHAEPPKPAGGGGG